MGHWADFFCVVTVQGITLLAVDLLEQKFNHRDRHDHNFRDALFASLVGGFALGIMFDFFLGGKLGVFQYYLSSHAFHLVNALLSYGIAIATALQFSPKPLSSIQPTAQRALVSLFLLTASCLILYRFYPNAMTLMWAVGALIVAGGELLERYCFGTLGPFLEGLSGRYTRILRNWLTAIAIGTIYEVANAAFPVWRWSFNTSVPPLVEHLVIVVFGYPVLFHVARITGLFLLSVRSSMTP